MVAGEIGSTIRRMRKRRGLKQRELALQSGIPETFLSRLEHGKLCNPTLKTLRRLAAVLEVPVGELIAESAESPPSPASSSPQRLRGLWESAVANLALDLQVYEQQPGLQALADDPRVSADLLAHEWEHLKAWASGRLARQGGSPSKARCAAELERYRRGASKLRELLVALADLDEARMEQVIAYVAQLRAGKEPSDVQ
ncbi:MAG: helix-turn-helix transcriptional regulator [Candidatus Tectomicrobia bacterium]|nr:helix-turn-helix transcriptional regulator [Candidatus Tectomicrobia bacterium]